MEENLSILNWSWATSNMFYFPEGHIHQVRFLNSNSDFLFLFFSFDFLSFIFFFGGKSFNFKLILGKTNLKSFNFKQVRKKLKHVLFPSGPHQTGSFFYSKFDFFFSRLSIVFSFWRKIFQFWTDFEPHRTGSISLNATSNRFIFLTLNSDFFFSFNFFWEENFSILNWFWATSNRFYFPLGFVVQTSKWLLISNDFFFFFFFFLSLGLSFSKKKSLGLSDYAIIFFSMCWFTNEKLNLCGRFWK